MSTGRIITTVAITGTIAIFFRMELGWLSPVVHIVVVWAFVNLGLEAWNVYRDKFKAWRIQRVEEQSGKKYGDSL